MSTHTCTANIAHKKPQEWNCGCGAGCGYEPSYICKKCVAKTNKLSLAKRRAYFKAPPKKRTGKKKAAKKSSKRKAVKR